MKKTIQSIRELIQSAKKEIELIPNDIFENKPLPHKWSKKEILGHLIDSALNNWKRISEISFCEGTYNSLNYAQDHLVKSNLYQEKDRTDLLNLWFCMNEQIVFISQNLAEEKFDNKIILPDGQIKTLKWLIKDYLEHLQHHVSQICNS